MKFKIVFIISALLLLTWTACKKEKFTTEPQVKIKSITPDVLRKGSLLRITAEFTDKEGDIQDSVLVVKNTYMANGTTFLFSDTFRYKINNLGLPDTRKGDIRIEFIYGENVPGYVFLPAEPVDRMASFGLIIRDRAGNRSNYAESKKIELKKP